MHVCMHYCEWTFCAWVCVYVCECAAVTWYSSAKEKKERRKEEREMDVM